jgi:hypothetical protein
MKFRNYCIKTLYQLEAASLLYACEGINVCMPERAARLLAWLRARYARDPFGFIH